MKKFIDELKNVIVSIEKEKVSTLTASATPEEIAKHIISLSGMQDYINIAIGDIKGIDVSYKFQPPMVKENRVSEAEADEPVHTTHRAKNKPKFLSEIKKESKGIDEEL